MATTLTRNLKLRVNSNLTADAIYNLNRIDALGGTFLVDTTSELKLRSKSNIQIEPESADLGGSGVGGQLDLGTPAHQLDNLNLFSNKINLTGDLNLLDKAVSGTRNLTLRYNSTLNGLVDTAADRALTFDLEGADRQVILTGDLKLAGNLTTLGGDLTFTTLAGSSVIVPATGTLATLAGVETLVNKTIDANNNTLLHIKNVNIDAAAAIDYSKLNLTNKIVDADVFSSAGIQYSKLALAGSIINSDISNSAAISYSKLALNNAILNSDINTAAAIAYSKLNLTNQLMNTDVNTAAAISGTKISPDFGTQQIKTQNNILFQPGLNYTTLGAAASGQVINLNFRLPADYGTGGQLLAGDGAGNLSWLSVSGVGTVTSVDLTVPADILAVSGNPITGAGTFVVTKTNQSANQVWAGPTSGGAGVPVFRTLVVADLPSGIPYSDLTLTNSIVNGDVAAGAAIVYSKLNLTGGIVNADVNNSAAIVYSKLNLSGSILNSDVNAAAGIVYSKLSLTNSIVDADINSAAAISLTKLNALTINRAIVSNGAGILSVSAVTSTELGYVSGVTSAIQTQLNGKEPTITATTSADYYRGDKTFANFSAAVGAIVGTSSFKTNWTSGTTFTATHNLGSRDVRVELYDNTTFDTILVDTVVRTTINSVDLSATQAPSGAGWRILITLVG